MNIKHSLKILKDYLSFSGQVSTTDKLILKTSIGAGELVNDAWGVQKVSLPRSVFHGMWTYDIPASMWFMYHNNAQVYTSTNIQSVGGVAQLTTDATNHTLKLESRECPRYQPNRGHLYSTALWCPNKTNDGLREWGLRTPENGVFFRLKSDGNLYAVLVSAGVQLFEDLIDTSSLAGFDVEKNNIYDIQFQWRSAGNYLFYIGDPATGASKLVHKFNLLGTLTSASIENPALPAYFGAQRLTQDVELNVGCVDITSENGLVNNEQYSSAYITGATAQTDTPIIVIHNPLLIDSKTNTRTVTLARISVNCSKKAVFKVWMTRDASAITGATLQPIGGGSYVQSDSTDMDATAVKASSVNTALMVPVTTISVEALIRISVDNPYRGRIEFPIVRGDYLVITATSASGAADCVVEMGEQI